VDAVTKYLTQNGTVLPKEVVATVEQIARSGGTPLVVAENFRALGVIYLKDIVKGGMHERFDQLRAMGIKTVMITGDNPLTAAAIAREAGVDDFLAEATPKDKMDLIRREQGQGKLVAMTGDGTNDAPALAQADVGVAMNTGTQAAKEAGNMVDLDSNPTKLIEIVEIGKQLLMTRGALTTFSIANDVAKYFCHHSSDVCGNIPSSECAEHHASADSAVGRTLGSYLQRPDHRCADSVSIARREIYPDERGGALAQESADLWRGRPDRAIRRNQADRHVHRQNWLGIARTRMKKHLITSLLMVIWTTVLLGLVYPLVVTGIAQVLFKDKANGQLITRDGAIIGSRIIGQPFSGPGYFHSRPSAAGNAGYDAANSQRSNLGPHQSEADRPSTRRSRPPEHGEPWSASSRGSRHGIGVRTRS
jgi:soluble P-type ATPase